MNTSPHLLQLTDRPATPSGALNAVLHLGQVTEKGMANRVGVAGFRSIIAGRFGEHSSSAGHQNNKHPTNHPRHSERE